MERGWVWTLMGVHSELWPPRCFSQNPSLVHRSPALFPLFPAKLPDLCFSRNPKLCGIQDSASPPHATIALPQAVIQKMESLALQ